MPQGTLFASWIHAITLAVQAAKEEHCPARAAHQRQYQGRPVAHMPLPVLGVGVVVIAGEGGDGVVPYGPDLNPEAGFSS